MKKRAACFSEPQSPRQRTAEHMRRLISKAAAGVSLGMMACGGEGDEAGVVCDPLPPPFSCDASTNPASKWMTVTAKWRTLGATNSVEVTFALSAYPASDHVSLDAGADAQAPITITGGALVSSSRQGASVIVTATPDAGAAMQLVVSYTCDKAPSSATVKVRSDLIAPADGAVISVEWVP